MLSRRRAWMFFPSLMFLWSCAVACDAPPGANFTDHPGYWCSLDARISASTMCDVVVQETIRVPWAAGILDRSVPTDDNQRITDVSAYRVLDGIRTAKLPVTKRHEAPNNRLLSVQVGQVAEPVSVLITYKKIGGVQIFSQCSGIGVFKHVNNSNAKTVMVSSWALGGRSISDVQHVTVTFSLPDDRKLKYIDSQSTVRTRFQVEKKINLENDAGTGIDQVRITYRGSTDGLSPSRLICYIRYYMTLGAQSCASSRDCKFEGMILDEVHSSGAKQRIIIGVCLTLVAIVVGMSITALVLYCKRVKARQLDSNVEDENLPESLRHFEYDTGAGETGEKRAEQVWMSTKSNEMKEEFYALDLSPRNRGKNGSEGF